MPRPCRLTCAPRFTIASLLFSLLLIAGLPVLPASAAADTSSRRIEIPPTIEALGGSLRFEANRGQANPSVRFLSRGPGYRLLLGSDGVGLTLRTRNGGDREEDSATIHLSFGGSRPSPVLEGLDELKTKVHYYLGSDPAVWRTGIPTYGRVRYDEVYPGIDVVFYGHEGELEYDLVVTPGADPGLIRMNIRGAEGVESEASGDLVLHAAGEIVRIRKPFVYQERDGGRVPISAEYSLVTARTGETQVAFRLAAYDPERALVIDPVVVYSTYVQGAAGESANSLARGADGSIGLVGQASLSWPYIPPPGYGGNIDAWVARLDPSGAPIYFAYLGGSDYEADMTGILDPDGNLIVVGGTTSRNFPTTSAIQPQNGGGTDVFATKFDPQGALVYSTYLGGRSSDSAHSVAVDAAGDAYLTGYASSAAFPTTPDAIQPTLPGPEGFGEAFLTRLSPTGALVYSTFLGGNHLDSGVALALDGAGGVYLTGITQSPQGFPLVNRLPGSPTVPQGGRDAFVAKLDMTAAPPQLVYSTLLGGMGQDDPTAIAVDAAGRAVVVGSASGPGFPLANPTQAYGGSYDAYVAKIAFDPATSATSLVFSTYLGGSGWDSPPHDVALDMNGNTYVVGATESTNFPTHNAAQGAYAGNYDAFVVKLDPTGSVVYSTYLGSGGQDVILGVDVDAKGSATVAGVAYPNWANPAATAPFPQVEPVQQPSVASQNGFVTKLNRAGGILYSSYLGGSGSDTAVALALDGDGSAYIAGLTASPDFPTANAVQGSLTGEYDGYVVKIHDENRPPAVSASGSPYDVAEGGAVTLVATGSDPEAGPITYAWDLDNDGTFETPGSTVSFSAAALDGPTTRTVGVQVTDEDGASATTSATIAVANVAPTATFAVSPPAPLVGACVTLTLSGASDPAPADQAALTFSFDCVANPADGFDRSGAQTSHTCRYTAAGAVTAAGRVADNDGGANDYSVQFQVRTAQAAIHELEARIHEIVAAGILSSAEANPLLATTTAAIRQLDRGNASAVIGILGALIQQVESLVARGDLPPGVGQELIDAANEILTALQQSQGGTCP
jgi:hypothetical protein